MSPRVKTSAVLDETEEVKPVKNIKEEKEKAKIMDKSAFEEDEEEIDINPQKYINVINLCACQLNLSTLPGGKGKLFTFNSFGETKRIMYSHLVDIMETSPKFVEDGRFYIAEKRVIRRHGLDSIYEKLLTKQMIESIFNNTKSPDDVSALYKSANKAQQETIIDLTVSKMMNDPNFDMNIVSAISKVSEINLQKKVDDEKFYSDPATA